jgi:hypothetical protein
MVWRAMIPALRNIRRLPPAHPSGAIYRVDCLTFRFQASRAERFFDQPIVDENGVTQAVPSSMPAAK